MFNQPVRKAAMRVSAWGLDGRPAAVSGLRGSGTGLGGYALDVGVDLPSNELLPSLYCHGRSQQTYSLGCAIYVVACP